MQQSWSIPSLSGILLLLACLTIHTNVHARATNIIQGGLHFQSVEMDLEVNGSIRQTRFNSIDVILRERLSPNLDGALKFGYLGISQKTNPIFAGQNIAGEYVGIDFRLHLIDTPSFKMLTNLDYRYAVADAEETDQTVEWRWHQVSIGLATLTQVSNHLHLSLGVNYLDINGVEKATGTIDQSLDFQAKDSLTGIIGLQLSTEDSGEIGIELKMGSSQGARLIFQRSF